MADDPTYGPDETVAVNAQRFANLLDSLVALAASEEDGLDALRQRIDDYENPAPVPAPTLSLSAPITKVEGNTGTTEYRWTLTLNRDGSTAAIPYSYSVAGSGSNPANASDFGGAFPSGSGTFAAGETTKQVVILAYADNAVEPDEQFTLTVSSSGLASVTSTGIIANDDTAPTPAFLFSGPATIAEGTPAAVVPAFAFTGPDTIGEGTPPPAQYGFTGPSTINEGN